MSLIVRKIIYLVLLLPTIALHSVIMTLINKKNLLQTNRYLIIASISLFDCCYCIFSLPLVIRTLSLGYMVNDVIQEILSTLVFGAFLTSMMCTCLLTIDRYAAVLYALRYHKIINKRRLLTAVIFFWTLSLILIILCKCLEKAKYFNDTPFRFGVAVVIILYSAVTTVCTLSIAVYTIIIRTKHVEDIRNTNKRFGVDAERLNLLYRVKRSLIDTIKLNILTVLCIGIISIFLILKTWYQSDIVEHYISLLIYICSNPYVYVLTQSELRKEIKRLICKKTKRENYAETSV